MLRESKLITKVRILENKYGSISQIPADSKELCSIRKMGGIRDKKLNENITIKKDFDSVDPLNLVKRDSNVELIRNLLAQNMSVMEVADLINSTFKNVTCIVSRYKLNQSYYTAKKGNTRWQSKSKNGLIQLIRKDGYPVSLYTLDKFYKCKHVLKTRQIKVKGEFV